MSSFAQSVGFLIGFPAVLIGVAALIIVANLVLGPVNRAAGRLRTPTRFQLNDFFWLVVQIQFALGFTVRFTDLKERSVFIVTLCFLMVATIVMWAAAVSFVSKAGVSDGWRRGVFVLIQLPGTLALMITTPLFLAASLYFPMVYAAEVSDGMQSLSGQTILMGLLQFLAGALALFLAGWGLRRASLWILAGSQRIDDPQVAVMAEIVNDAWVDQGLGVGWDIAEQAQGRD